VSTIRGHFGRIKSSIDNKCIEYKEDGINTITPDLHKEIHRETARQLATQVRESTDMDIRITQIEERETTHNTQRKMEERVNKLENFTQELTQELKATQDRTESVQRRIDSLEATMRTQETDNQRESRHTRTATPDTEHHKQRYPTDDAAGNYETNYHETSTPPIHNRWNVDPETLGHQSHDPRSMPKL
jgi:chromosome segregation ATPase